MTTASLKQEMVKETEPRAKKRDIAIVVPAYNESTNLELFRDAVHTVIKDMDQYNWKFVFVNDGSVDDTWEVVQHLATEDSRIQGVSLSRNFGKEIALTAGVEALENIDAVILMDADLQHPPPLIEEMVAKWEEGFQVVATQRSAIEYSWFREWGSRAFYYLLNKFSEVKIQPKAADFRLLDREVLKVLRNFQERTRFFRGLVDWMGFKKTYIQFVAPARAGGESSFSLRALIDLAINSFTSFSLLPLRITGWLGLIVLAFGVGTLIFMVITGPVLHLTHYTALAYFVVFNTVLTGVVLAALGMMALYIGNIHTEVARRPLYIVDKRVGFKHE